MTYPYYRSNCGWFFSAKETAFRTNAHGKDTANEAGDTFFALPLLIDEHPIMREHKNFKHFKGSNSRFTIRIYPDKYKPLKLTFSGPVYNHSLLMYFGTTICTTSDDTPSAGYYTHQCDSADTFPGYPPTFQLLHKMHNDAAGNVEWDLYTGCTILSYKEKADRNGILIGTYEIEAARNITGVALTSEPAIQGSRALHIGDSSVTWGSYGYILQEYEFEYKTGNSLMTAGGDYYASYALMGEIDFFIRLKFLPLTDDTYDDSNPDPSTDASTDLTVKTSRNTTTDYWQVKINDYFNEMLAESMEERRLNETLQFVVNPSDSGSSWDLTEVNDLDDDRYET